VILVSRKDYQLIAGVIQDLYTRALRDGTGDPVTLERVAVALCSDLAADNPRFDRDRFLAAAVPGMV
jgi:hypothetical protein